MRILIVEDNLLTRVMMERSLKKWGYDIVSVDNINSAVAIIVTEEIQFVITDWVMPGGNGILLCQRVRALKLPFYTYIILVTSLDDAQSAVQGMDAGADDFIRKPIQLDELHARIRAAERILALEKKLRENNLRLTEISNQLLDANDVINRDLYMAAAMQLSLLPTASSANQGIAIDWLFHPSPHLSGDIFNFFQLDEHHLGFYIIDVAGHCIASAIQSFILSHHLKLAPNSPILNSAPAVVANLNQQFQTDDSNILYFTMIYGVINTLSHTIDLCQAGHPHPLFQQPGNPAEFIVGGGLPVGVITDVMYESVQLKYGAGDRLFLYSDGITECESPAGEMFGAERLRRFVDETRHLNVSEVISQLDEHISSWRKGAGFEDDISLLVLEMDTLGANVK